VTIQGRRRHRTPEPWTPNGHCRGCGTPLKGRQKVWCSSECGQRFWAQYSWNLTRSYVLKRDNYTCRLCGHKGGRLEADHIRPISEGGAEFDLDNLRTLCHDCHVGVTAPLRKRLAVRQQQTKYVMPWPGLE